MFTEILLNLFFIYVASILSNSCLLEMEQEMEKGMISVDSVRYWPDQFGYSNFSR